MTTTTTGSAFRTATLDHRTGATLAGGPANRYHRVARCDGRHSQRFGLRPNFAARRLGALFFVLSGVMVGTWLAGEVAAEFAGQPASAAQNPAAAGLQIHVARSGDTLWSIADTHRGEVNRDHFIDALVSLNGGTSIHVGQAVHLP